MDTVKQAQKEALDLRLRFLISSMKERIAGDYDPEHTLKLYKESLKSAERELDRIKQIECSKLS